MNDGSCCSAQEVRRGIAHAGVIDLMVRDPEGTRLVMVEDRPWDGSERRLWELQEKINAYLSFALDGEMAHAYPDLVGKPMWLQLDCVEPPDRDVQQFCQVVRDQIAFQGIGFDVRVTGPSCGTGCGCV